MSQSGTPIRRRTAGERASYMDGFDAGIRAVERELKRGLLGTEAVDRAKTSASLVRSVGTESEQQDDPCWRPGSPEEKLLGLRERSER